MDSGDTRTVIAILSSAVAKFSSPPPPFIEFLTLTLMPVSPVAYFTSAMISTSAAKPGNANINQKIDVNKSRMSFYSEEFKHK